VRSIQATQGVLTGYPHWRHFQSRLLGPWIVESLTSFGINFAAAHLVIAAAILTLTSVVLFHAGRVVAGRQAGWSALFTFFTLFMAVMNRPWLYVWDYFIVLTGALFLLLVVCRAPWWAFLLLMGVAFFNHETAAVIGIWMIAQPLADWRIGGRGLNWKMLASGVLGGVAGEALTEYLRATLLKQEIGWQIFTDVGKGPSSPLDSYFHVQIVNNMNEIAEWVTNPQWDFLFLIPFTLVVALALAALIVARHGVKAVGLGVYVAAQVAALLAFGLRSETRNLLQLVPFLSLGGILAATPNWRDPAPADALSPALPASS
jgi:hypothetical protein